MPAVRRPRGLPGRRRQHVPVSARSAALALLIAGCGPQTGLLLDVRGPDGQSSVAAGVAQLEVRLAHYSYCDRWIEDTADRVTVDVHARDLNRSPFELLVRPAHAINLSDRVLVTALAKDQSGRLIGEAGFGPHPFSLHQYLEFGEPVVLLDRAQTAAGRYLSDDGCTCMPGEPWMGSGGGHGCDALVVPSFDSLASVGGCELAPMSPESRGPVCDGQQYPLTFYDEPRNRPLPCFAPAPNAGGCAVGTRRCQDSDGVAYTEQCAVAGGAAPLPSSKLCDAYLGCDGCGDLQTCFRQKLGPPLELRCLVHLDPQQAAPAPCTDGKWQSAPLGMGAGCQAVMLDGTAQPPFTVGFAGADGLNPGAAAACPAVLVLERVQPDPMDQLTVPRELYFVIGEQLAHATLTVVRGCGPGGSLECHSG